MGERTGLDVMCTVERSRVNNQGLKVEPTVYSSLTSPSVIFATDEIHLQRYLSWHRISIVHADFGI